MEENKKLEKRKNIEIVVLSIIVVALLGILIYLLFIKKDKENTPLKPQDNQQINNTDNGVKFSKIELNENNKSVTINGKNIKLKTVEENNNYNLYLNDEKVFTNTNPGIISAYIIDNLIAVYWEGSMWQNTLAFLDVDGKIVLSPVSEYPVSIFDLRIENNKLVATRSYNGEMDCAVEENNCTPSDKVEFVYDGKNITLKKIY